jgi:hypothetical protein
MEINNDEIKKEERVCYNCQYIAWAIGVGQGLKCCNPKKINEDNSIPNKRHTCELFRYRDTLGEPEKRSWMEN